MKLNGSGSLGRQEAQRVLLEITVRMWLMFPDWQQFNHLRITCNDGGADFLLLDADANGVRAEKHVKMGETAREVARAAVPVLPSSVDTVRFNISFRPPKMTIDALDGMNHSVFTDTLIDHDLEERIKKELLTNLRSS